MATGSDARERSGHGPGGRDGHPGDGEPAGTLRFLLQDLVRRLHTLGWQLERLQLAEYVALFENPRRLLWINFLGGVMRGLGIAVGFSLLGALVLYLLQRVVMLNLPVIGELIAQIVRMVQTRIEVMPGP